MRSDEVRGGPFDGWTPGDEALHARRCCTDCASTDLRWVPAARLVAVLAEVNEAQARETFEMFTAVGAVPTSSAWACECGAYGVIAAGSASCASPDLVGGNRAERRRRRPGRRRR